MTLIVDATPLIVLAKSDHLDVLTGRDETPVVPALVYDEVVETGLSAGYPDARRIERAIENGHFAVEDAPESALFEELASSPALSEADAAVLALAADRDGVAVMDEQAGRAAADAEGIETRGTAYVVLSSVERGEQTPAEARSIIDDIVEAGWHCSTDLYAQIVRKLEEMDEVADEE
ncbi:DUF3368 domain-containing protein [Halomicrobium salinisoli]|uniref:DUF3368 domain-containing protein n=1 Tax=Halomicrobium salinisoli TaxID=2878391 RepID=UPI001CF0C301|nr:DUF3368 domain-containing protein [Halomicrobium salinisoli]